MTLRIGSILKPGSSAAEARAELARSGVKVPSDYGATPSDHGNGYVFRPPDSTNDDSAIRVMDSSANPTLYPNGYYRVYNNEGVPVDGNGVSLGNAGVGQPETHFGLPDDFFGE
jgi:hypothetical protein